MKWRGCEAGCRLGVVDGEEETASLIKIQGQGREREYERLFC